MIIILYGLKNCDICKKVIKWFDCFYVLYIFVDYCEYIFLLEILIDWVVQVGGFVVLVNCLFIIWW